MISAKKKIITLFFFLGDICHLILLIRAKALGYSMDFGKSELSALVKKLKSQFLDAASISISEPYYFGNTLAIRYYFLFAEIDCRGCQFFKAYRLQNGYKNLSIKNLIVAWLSSLTKATGGSKALYEQMFLDK